MPQSTHITWFMPIILIYTSFWKWGECTFMKTSIWFMKDMMLTNLVIFFFHASIDSKYELYERKKLQFGSIYWHNYDYRTEVGNLKSTNIGLSLLIERASWYILLYIRLYGRRQSEKLLVSTSVAESWLCDLKLILKLIHTSKFMGLGLI